ncbi:MAG: aldo/keto reductase, partial [Candidatus Dormibacteria bacterium]
MRRLGVGGPMVTRFGLGLAAIGRPAYINLNRGRDLPGSRSVAAMRTRAHGLLDHALERGVRYFDAAR